MRGWTRDETASPLSTVGFPAHAGMDPWSFGRERREPRLPRACGDGPPFLKFRNAYFAASPRMRGWTRSKLVDVSSAPGFPAHAGMDHQQAVSEPVSSSLPRSLSPRLSRLKGAAMRIPTRAAPPDLGCIPRSPPRHYVLVSAPRPPSRSGKSRR